MGSPITAVGTGSLRGVVVGSGVYTGGAVGVGVGVGIGVGVRTGAGVAGRGVAVATGVKVPAGPGVEVCVFWAVPAVGVLLAVLCGGRVPASKEASAEPEAAGAVPVSSAAPVQAAPSVLNVLSASAEGEDSPELAHEAKTSASAAVNNPAKNFFIIFLLAET